MTYENLLLTPVLDLDGRLAGTVNDLEGPVLHVGLNLSILKLSANQSLGVENSVVRVHGDLVLGGVTDQSLRVVESDVRGSGSVTLVVRCKTVLATTQKKSIHRGHGPTDDLDTVILPHGNTRVSSTLLLVSKARV